MFGTSCRGAGAAAGGHGRSGVCMGTAQAQRAPTAGAGAGTAAGGRLALAAGTVFASQHQTRQVSPVPQPALPAGLQLGLHPATTASPVPQGALLSHDQTPPHIPLAAHGKGSQPKPHLISHSPRQGQPAQCHPVKDTLPFCSGQGRSFCVFPCAHRQGGGTSCTTLPRPASPAF